MSFPKIIIDYYGSSRAFKSQKRMDLKSTLSKLDELSFGCSYSPAYREIVEARRLLKIAKEKQSVKKWGR